MPTSRSGNATQRRDVLRTLARVKRQLKTLTGWWDVTSKVYMDRAERPPDSNVYLRPRETYEYPENRANYWSATFREVDSMITSLEALRDQARERYQELRDRERYHELRDAATKPPAVQPETAGA